jgi:XisI protein
MDTLDSYRDIIEKVLTEYASIPSAYGEVETEVAFDRKNDRYLMVCVGWEERKRVHDCIVHIDIIDGKIWIQYDGIEHGIALDFTEAGIPKEQIVLAFHPPDVRKYTEYAIA